MAAEIRAAPSPWECEATARLFQMAAEDGRIALRRFQKQLGDEALRDLVHDLLAAKLPAIVAHPDPRGCFWIAVVRLAISHLRKDLSHVAETSEAAAGEVRDAAAEALTERMDLQARWERLSPREQEVLTAIREGEDREALARRYGVTRSAIDKVWKRASARLWPEET